MKDEIVNKVNERLDLAIERGKELISSEELKDAVEDMKLRSENFIRKNPVKSVLIGFSVGFILSRIFSDDD
jgi:ElaB/YqjD/DUF883 family membrane-anchored ribosome-binding protein